MSPRIPFQTQFSRLSKTEKAFSSALFLQVVYWLVEAVAGVQLPGWALVRLVFIGCTILFLVRSFPRLVRKLLWRVRHRLLVTWIFLGVVPIVLICALVAEGLFILMGQAAGYMTTAEISRQTELVRSTAETLGWSVTHRASSTSLAMVAEPFVRETSGARRAEVGTVVRSGKDALAVPAKGAIAEIPEWSKPGFAGLMKRDRRYYFGAHLVAGEAAGDTELFLYQHAPDDFFKNLLPDVATIQFLDVEVRTQIGGIDIQRTDRPRSGFSINAGPSADDPDAPPLPAPPGRGWWDVPVRWLVPVPVADLGTGKPAESLAVVASRPSLILPSAPKTSSANLQGRSTQ